MSKSFKLNSIADKTKLLRFVLVLSLIFNFLLPHVFAAEPKITVIGTVTDASNGEPYPGVNVIIEGTSIGTITDINGKYTINVPSKQSVLLFTAIGFQKEKRQVNNQTIINLSLSADVQTLDEVVVVAYGSQKKETLTGAIANVKSAELLRAPVSNLTNSLVGRMSGITAIQRTGEPGGDAAQLYVRGVSTFGGSAAPLVLVDGIERSYGDVDVNEVETISVLKDASATAVFGVRGANGVVIITTKRGQEGKPKVSLTTNFGYQNPINLPKLLNAYDYATLRNEAAKNVAATPVFSAYDIERYLKHDDPVFHPDIDWMEESFRKYTPQNQHNLNVSGGTKNARYFVSMGLLDQDGIFKVGNFTNDISPNPYYKRYNIRGNLDFDLTKNFSLSINNSISIAKSNYAGSGSGALLGQILGTSPLSGNVSYNGAIVRETEFAKDFSITNPPLYQLYVNGYNQHYESNFKMDVSGVYKLDDLIKGLRVRGKFAYDNYYKMSTSRSKNPYMVTLRRNPNAKTFNDSIVPIVVVDRFEGPVTAGADTYSKNRRMYGELALEYSTKIEEHSISALALGTAERLYNGSDGQLPFNYMGLVGRVTYNYKNKYLADVNAGYNGSENFYKNKQFGFFPSFSLGYVLTEESFIPKNEYLTHLKIRGSYGLVGNDKAYSDRNLGRFLFSDGFTGGGSYYFGTTPTTLATQASIRENTLGNRDVTWETALKQNIGFDLHLFKEKLSLSADLFSEKRDNILWSLNIPISFGKPSLVNKYNIGKASNYGYEFELSFNDRLNAIKGLNYWLKANYSFSENKIIYMDESPQIYDYQYRTGNRIGQPFGLQALGFYNTPEECADPNRPKSIWEPPTGVVPGNIKYKDQNGDGIINTYDEVAIGYPNVPLVVYGFSGGFEWKGFEISVLFQGTGMVSTYLIGDAQIPFGAGKKSAMESVKERWTPERYAAGEPITFPRLIPGASNTADNDYINSSFWQKDASYLRLKNAEVAYNFSSKLLKPLQIKSLRLFVNGQNLFTWSKVKNFDPEIAANSGGGIYPMVRVFNVGANISF